MDLNPHPALTAFPVVIISLIILIELIQIKFKNNQISANLYMLCIALIVFCPITFLTGYIGQNYANQSFQVSPELIDNHKLLAQAVLISLVPFGVFFWLRRIKAKNNFINYSYYISLLLCAGLIYFTAFKGGELVFKHGAGVSAELSENLK